MRALLLLVVVASACTNGPQSQPEPMFPLGPTEHPLQNPRKAVLLAAGPVQCATANTGTQFADATDDWGLGKTGLSLTGNRLTVADLDADGYPDLVVHAVTSNASQQKVLPDGGVHWVRQLMNRPSPDGTHRVFVDATDNGLFEVRGGSTTRYRSAQLMVFGDVDNDGDLDAYSGTYVDPTKPMTDPGDRSQILINDGTGHFTLAPETAATPTADQRMPTSSATFTDVDRDGKIDLFVGHWYAAYGQSSIGVQARLFQGLGTGEFYENTAPAGLQTTNTGYAAFTNHRPAYGVTACDLDDDGAPELMVSAYGRQPNLLYRNDGAGHFADQSRESHFSGDDNLDFTDNENFRCWCMGNPANAACANVTSPSIQCPNPPTSGWGQGVDDQPWRNNGNTFTTWCGDIDGDGKNDLYNAEIHHWWAGQSSDSSELMRNVGTGPGAVRLQRPGNAVTGLQFPHLSTDWNEGGLMAAGGDLDNDGKLDLVVGTSDYPDQFGLIFAQKPDGTFEEKSLAWNLRHECMSGLAVADFDRDGDLDVIAGASTARDCRNRWSTNEVHLYENRVGQTNWLLLHLEANGTTANRAAIGAKITVKANGQTQTREVTGGYGHFGMQNDLTIHFGLGGCAGADEVTVRWPDAQGTTQTFVRVPANAFLRLKQGEETPYVVQ